MKIFFGYIAKRNKMIGIAVRVRMNGKKRKGKDVKQRNSVCYN